MNDNKVVSTSIIDEVGIIQIDNPPVNALSTQVRQGIVDAIDVLVNDNSVKVIVLQCAEKTFIAGADIKEFGLPPAEPFLPDVVNIIEASTKPVVAALFGTSLGGGAEVALACHYRVALKNTRIGFPEVNLGLIPGAGGTQRLPRVVGVKKALEMITSGKHYQVSDFLTVNNSEPSFIDLLVDTDQDINSAALQFAKKLIQENKLNPNPVSDKTVNTDNLDWQKEISLITKKARGKDAPIVAANVIKDTHDLSVVDGMKIEREAFLKLRDSEQSAALRFAFAAEKKSSKTNIKAEPLTVKQVGIVGAGNMGSGIATVFLSCGFNVILIEQNEQGLTAGVERINKNFQANVSRGRMTQSSADQCLSLLQPSIDFNQLAQCDLIIEAIFEDLTVKKDLFKKLDQVCQSSCIFATNTSYLDINEIASVVAEPSRVIGMHFFSPANIMKLLEVVKAKHSSEQALATAMVVGKKLKKMSVLVGVCFGFAGNRMYTRYGREVQQMLLEGAKIEQVDQALIKFGMAMGPLAVQDLSGIDIGHNARSAQPFPEYDPGYFRAAAVMVENNRLGRKTKLGFYQYDENNQPTVDVKAQQLIQDKAKELGITQKSFTDDEIVERALLALISEGLALYKDGIVQRLSDIDVIWLHGYGFPRHKGGPMYCGKMMGQTQVSAKLAKLRETFGNKIWPEVDVSVLDGE